MIKTEVLSEVDRRRGYRLFQVPVMLTIAALDSSKAVKNLHDLVRGDGLLYDIYGFKTTGRVYEAEE